MIFLGKLCQWWVESQVHWRKNLFLKRDLGIAPHAYIASTRESMMDWPWARSQLGIHSLRPFLIFGGKIMMIIKTAIIKNLKLKSGILKRQVKWFFFLKATHSDKKQSPGLWLHTANIWCLINDIVFFGRSYRNYPCCKPIEIYPKAIRFCITLLGKP